MPDNGKTGNLTHDSTMQKAQHDWQIAIAAAGSQSAVRAADIAFYQTKVTSARAAGLTEPLTTAIFALRCLNATVPT
jgi:hypothetical protein